MISMMPPGAAIPGGAPSATPWTRQRTMMMSVPQLTSLLQSDDRDAAAAAKAELDARQIDVPTQSADQLSGPMLPGGAIAAVANGQATPGNVGNPLTRPDNVPPPSRAAMNSGAAPQQAQQQAAPPLPPSPEEAIQKGIDQADAAQDPLAGMHPALKQAAAQIAAASPDSQQSGAVGDIIKSLSGYAPNPNLAIAKAGFAMAGSRNPFFFGALGEGANAGIDEYQRQQEQALLEKAKAAGLIQNQQQFGETQRSNLVNEQQRQQTIQQAAANNQLAQQEFQEKVREYNAGYATEQELKQAQIRAQNASAAYQQVAAGEAAARTSQIGVQYGQDADGNMVQIRGTQATPVTDAEGHPIQAQKWGARPNTVQSKADLMRAGGMSDKEIADAVSGRKPLDPARIETVASNAAKNAASNVYDPNQAQQIYQSEYTRIKGELTGGLTPNAAATAPGAAASGAATPGNTAPAAPAAQPPGQPIVAQTQADIDNAPSGAVIIVNGKKFRKP